MSLVHHLAGSLIVSALKGVADVQHALDLADDVLRAEEILLRNLGTHFLKPDTFSVGEELYVGMVLADGGRGILAGGAALVVGRRGELVLDTGVKQHELVAGRFWIEGEVFVLQRLAVEADKASCLAETGGELVHDAAVDAAVIVLGGLADLGELELVDTVTVQLVDGKGKSALKGGRRGEARAERDVAGEDRVEAGDLAAALGRLAAYAENIAGPSLLGFVFLLESKLYELVIVEGIRLDLVRPVERYLRHDAFVNGSGEYISSVIVSMFTDKIDASCRCEHFSVAPVKGAEFLLDSLFHCHGYSFLHYPFCILTNLRKDCHTSSCSFRFFLSHFLRQAITLSASYFPSRQK